jgi:hypothetical protein
MMRLIFLIFICIEIAFSQIAPNHCVLIDTIETVTEDIDISKPVEIDTLNGHTTAGKIVLMIASAVGVPMTTGLVLLSLFPPHYALIKTDDYQQGIGFEIALGFGDSTRFRFSNYRIILGYTYFDGLKNRVFLALSRDFVVKKFGRLEIFGFGFSSGIFGWTNFNGFNTAGFEFSIWIGNAMNIPYIFLFPQHHLFVKVRGGTNFKSKTIKEISFGVSSSFTLKK